MAYTDPRSNPPVPELPPEPPGRDPLAITIWLVRAVTYVAYAFFIVSEIILLQGFVLKLLGADTSAAYTEWAYRNLDRVMAPFRGIFTPVDLSGDSVLDTSIIFAMVVYGIVLLVLRAFLDWLTYRLRKIEHEQRELVRQAEVARRQAAGQTWMTVPTPPMPSTPSQVATAAPASAPPPPPAPPERPWEA